MEGIWGTSRLLLSVGALAVVIGWHHAVVSATSAKMDFITLANVRTDPVLNPHCLSDHVHTFYGANASLRPETSYEDVRAAKGNSGNVRENKSLYWHPTIYLVDRVRQLYHLAPIKFASAYYIWETGETTAFPNGFKMIVSGANAKARALADCSGPSECERDNCQSDSTFFPTTACSELEMKIVFPSCWDGVNLDSNDHMSHVSFDLSEDGVFDGECPQSHPVKIPEIQFYFRIYNYLGGQYMFADGSDNTHADYFSGWNETELQRVLDECTNDSDAASPDAWCENHLTYLDGPKEIGDDHIVPRLLTIQPPPLRTNETVTPERIDDVPLLPRGSCSGTLLPHESLGSPTSQSPTTNHATTHTQSTDTSSSQYATTDAQSTYFSSSQSQFASTETDIPSSTISANDVASSDGTSANDDNLLIIIGCIVGVIALGSIALVTVMCKKTKSSGASVETFVAGI